jgi:mycothione reductase
MTTVDLAVDLAIIGSGSGNAIGTHHFDAWQIAVIEEHTFGGTCLNVGCIPTKMYVYPADIATAVHEAGPLGLDAHVDRVRWRDMRDRIFDRLDDISENGEQFRRTGRPNTRLITEHVEFADAHTLVTATGQRIVADQIVIATGSRAVIPDVIASGDVAYHTSDTVMRIDELPQRAIIVGGGYIAAEFAHIFSSFGVHTTMLVRGDRLLRRLDRDIAERYTATTRPNREVRLHAELRRVRQVGAEIVAELTDGTSVTADVLLVATGRRPNSDLLNLAAAGVALHPDGRVIVDEYQRTTADRIWALGDVCSVHQLKHVANHEARVVAHNLLHPHAMVEADHRYVPAAVFTSPQLASVGLTEDEASATGRRITAAAVDYGTTAYGWAMEDTVGVCKLVADADTGELLGAHLLGEQASNLIQPLIQAMSFGLTARAMARGQYWIHPALTEVVENALLDLDVPRLDWEEPKEADRPEGDALVG